MEGERENKWTPIGLRFKQVEESIFHAIANESNSLPKDIVNNKKSTWIQNEN